jgi:hypothetical protein
VGLGDKESLMQIICVLPSGRMIDRTILEEDRVRDLAAEFPTINYFFFY